MLAAKIFVLVARKLFSIDYSNVFIVLIIIVIIKS